MPIDLHATIRRTLKRAGSQAPDRPTNPPAAPSPTPALLLLPDIDQIRRKRKTKPSRNKHHSASRSRA